MFIVPRPRAATILFLSRNAACLAAYRCLLTNHRSLLGDRLQLPVRGRLGDVGDRRRALRWRGRADRGDLS